MSEDVFYIEDEAILVTGYGLVSASDALRWTRSEASRRCRCGNYAHEYGSAYCPSCATVSALFGHAITWTRG